MLATLQLNVKETDVLALAVAAAVHAYGGDNAVAAQRTELEIEFEPNMEQTNGKTVYFWQFVPMCNQCRRMKADCICVPGVGAWTGADHW